MGYAILKTIHSLHFMIVNHRMDPGILGILAVDQFLAGLGRYTRIEEIVDHIGLPNK